MKVYLRTWRTPDGETHRARTFSLLYSVAGKRHHQSLHTRDRRAAELIAADIVRKAELRRAGVRDPYEDHKERPILEHVDDFMTTIRARGVVAKYLAEREGHLRTFVAAADVKSIADLDVTRASAWLQAERDRGLSARSVNGRRAALAQFSGWLRRARRASFDSLAGLQPLNEAEDRRHVRRALTPEEAGRLIEAARTRAIARAGKPHPKRINVVRRERQARTLVKMAKSIKENIEKDGLDPRDILIVFPDPRTIAKTAAPVVHALDDVGLQSHIAGVLTSRDELFSDGSVAISGIFRAKGNEAPMVYVMNADYCAGDYDLKRRRNSLFTAITRSRAWVRISGTGTSMAGLEAEFKEVKSRDFTLEFDVPTKDQLERIRRIHRDMSPEEHRKVAETRTSFASMLADLEAGKIFLEDLPPELVEGFKQRLLKDLGKRK